MSQQDAIARQKTSYRRETGGYVPRQFNPQSRERFMRDRRQKHLGRCVGPPSDTQIAMVQSLATLEWAALCAEDDGTLRALREAREHRRLHLQVLRDFEKTLGPVPASKDTAMIAAPSASVPKLETVTNLEPELPFPSTRRAKRYRDHAEGRG